ncbi:MAG: hypothetical protein J6Q10_01785 [Clostridia bacterium]|nr:hypothetical protein [Clostridia bacterium]
MLFYFCFIALKSISKIKESAAKSEAITEENIRERGVCPDKKAGDS